MRAVTTVTVMVITVVQTNLKAFRDKGQMGQKHSFQRYNARVIFRNFKLGGERGGGI